MAEEKKGPKVVTIIIKVDLGCSCCAGKIKRTLCKLQKKFRINSITFDWKDTVTVTGPFDPNAFIKKLCCLAHKVIKDVYIKPDPPPKPPDPPKPDPPKPCPCPPPCLPICPPPPCPPICPPPCPPQCLPPCPPPCLPPCPPLDQHPCPPMWPPIKPPCPPSDHYPFPPMWPPLWPPTKPPIMPLPELVWPPACKESCSGNTAWPPSTCSTGYPCFKIVCESERSSPCSLM